MVNIKEVRKSKRTSATTYEIIVLTLLFKKISTPGFYLSSFQKKSFLTPLKEQTAMGILKKKELPTKKALSPITDARSP
jgi:hypothetical protein